MPDITIVALSAAIPALYTHGVFVHTARIVENVVGWDFWNDSRFEILEKYCRKCGRFCIQKKSSKPRQYKRCSSTARLMSAIVNWLQHSQMLIDSNWDLLQFNCFNISYQMNYRFSPVQLQCLLKRNQPLLLRSWTHHD